MVEELKLAIKVDDDAIEQSLLKQFANAEKMANKVVLTFNNIDLDNKAIEAKFKEMQKIAGKNPIDLSIDKSSIEMLSAISKQLGNIFDIAKGKSIIDSSATVSEINKITQATKESNKAQTESENIQRKSFRTKNKTEAYNQLKQMADVFKNFYDNEEAMHTKAGTEAAHAYYKAYEEALRKGVAESKLQKVTVDVDKDGFFNADRVASARIQEFENFKKYGGEAIALSVEISSLEERLLKFSNAYSKVKTNLGDAPITPEIIQDIEKYVHNLEIAESIAKDADSLGFTKEDIDLYKDSADMYLGFATEDAIKENEKYISSLKEVKEEKEKVDETIGKFSPTSSIDDSKFEELKSDITEVRQELDGVKEKISGIDSDGFESIKSDVERTTESVKELNSELTELKSKVSDTSTGNKSNISSENIAPIIDDSKEVPKIDNVRKSVDGLLTDIKGLKHYTDEVFDSFDPNMFGSGIGENRLGNATYFFDEKNKGDWQDIGEHSKYLTTWSANQVKLFNQTLGFTEEEIERIIKEFYSDLDDDMQEDYKFDLKNIMDDDLYEFRSKFGVELQDVMKSLGYDAVKSTSGEYAFYNTDKLVREAQVYDNEANKIIEVNNKVAQSIKETSSTTSSTTPIKDVSSNISSENITVEVSQNDEATASIRKKKEELASYELQLEETRYEIEKLAKSENEAYGFSREYSDKQVESIRNTVTDSIFAEPDIGGRKGSNKWFAFGNLTDISTSALKTYQMWQEELQKVGYTLSEIRDTSVGLEADILPIDGKAITNAGEFRKALDSITTAPSENVELLNKQIAELEAKTSSLKSEISSLESSKNSPIKDVFQGDKIDHATTSAKELDKTLEQVNIPTDSFDEVLSKLDLTKSELKEIVKITKQSVSDSEGKFHDSYTLKDKLGSTEIYGLSSNTEKGQLLRSNIVGYDAKEIEKETKAQQKAAEQEAKALEKVNKEQQKVADNTKLEEQKRIYKELNNSLDRYATVSKRIASGNALGSDEEEAAKLQERIEELQNEPILSKEQLELSQSKLEKIETTLEDIQKITKETTLDSLQSEIDSFNKDYDNRNIKPTNENRSGEYSQALNEYKNSITALIVEKERLSKLDNISEEELSHYNKLKEAAQENANAFKAMSAAQKGSTPLSRGKTIEWANDLLKENTKWSKKARTEVQGWIDKLATADPSNVEEIRTRILEIARAEREAGREGRTWLDIFKNKKLHSFLGQAASMFSFYDFIRYGREGIDTIREFDDGLTKISYTMDITKSQLDDLGKSVLDMANDLDSSINNVMQVSQIYANMNTSAEEIKKLSEPTLILSNLTGFDASTVANDIQAVTQQFEIAAEESMHIADVYDEISRNISVDYSKGIESIAEAVQLAGSTANQAGLNFEQLAAIVGKTAEKTRLEGSQIGNGLKTIMTRLSKVGKLSDEVDNETLSQASESLHQIGVEVYNADGSYRQFDVIMGELAGKWDSLTDAEKSNVSFSIAA